MSAELLINVTPQETRVATVENGQLVDIRIERVQKIGLVGTIFQGTVRRVLPGMEAAFVDIGLDKAAFLHVSDLVEARSVDEHGERVPQPIARHLREGQTLAVQVVKDPLGTKGARVSSNLTAPSRYLVMMPSESGIGISTRIDDEGERERLPALPTVRRTAPVRAAIAQVPEDKRWLVSSEGAFSYLARDYDLKELYLWPINADAQGTPQQVRRVIDTVRENNIGVVFSESTISAAPAEQVSRETGARYGGALYVDSLSVADGPVPTYLDLLRVTSETILKGLTE